MRSDAVHLTPFKVHDPIVNTVHCAIAIVSLLLTAWLWHLKMAIGHIKERARRARMCKAINPRRRTNVSTPQYKHQRPARCALPAVSRRSKRHDDGRRGRAM